MQYEDTVQYKGREIHIFRDEYPDSPRTDWEQIGTMVCWHRRYSLGDPHGFKTPRDWRIATALEYVDIANIDDVSDEKLMEIIRKHNILLPLYLYDHSGITMSTTKGSCRWDSGQVGWIYCSKKAAIRWWGSKILTKRVREKAVSRLESEVMVYDQYLTGDVYGWEAGGESCWGYYGYDHEESGLLEQARNAIDQQIQGETEEIMKETINGLRYSSDRCEKLAEMDRYTCGSSNYCGTTSLLLAKNGVFLLMTEWNGQSSHVTSGMSVCEDPVGWLDGVHLSDAEEKRLLDLGLIVEV